MHDRCTNPALSTLSLTLRGRVVLREQTKGAERWDEEAGSSLEVWTATLRTQGDRFGNESVAFTATLTKSREMAFAKGSGSNKRACGSQMKTL